MAPTARHVIYRIQFHPIVALPSSITLKCVVKLPLLATFTGVVTVGNLTIGITFNAITDLFIWKVTS